MTVRYRHFPLGVLGAALLGVGVGACSVGYRGAPPAAAATTAPTDGPRIAAPDALALVPYTRMVATPWVVPRYPDSAKLRGDEAAVTVAFVVDTNGAVEHRTISFLDSAPAAPASAGVASEFEGVVCDALRHQRFHPVRGGDGRAQRVLTVTDYVFALAGGRLVDYRVALEPFEALLAADLADGGSLVTLEAARHCR
jgi:hypothetical protein